MSNKCRCSGYSRLLKVAAIHVILFLSVIAVSNFAAMNTAFGVQWTSDSARLEHYVKESDRIAIGMVTDREIIGNTEYIWISVYDWLKNEATNADQIILDLEVAPSASEPEFAIGEEVLLMLTDIDVINGHFGLYHPYFDWPSKYPLTLKDEVLSLVEKSSENKTREQKEEEELQRLLNQSDNENCDIMETEWIEGGRRDKFFYCTYENEDERFQVAISVTLTHVKQELLKHVSEQYFDEHFDLRRAWDEAAVNGHAVPVGQTLEFDYALGNFTFVYFVRVSLGNEVDDRNTLYMHYTPPKEITGSAIRDRSQIDEIIYGSNCLQDGTPYILYDAAAASHVDRGFSSVIGGRGPPDVFDRNGDQIRDAERRFQIWFDTGEIQCTSNVNEEDEIDKTVGRQDQIVLMDASDYVVGVDSKPVSNVDANLGSQLLSLIFGTGAAVAGIVVFLALKRHRR